MPLTRGSLGLSDDQHMFVGPQDQQPRRPEAAPPSCPDAAATCGGHVRPLSILQGGPEVPARLALLVVASGVFVRGPSHPGSVLWTVAMEPNRFS